MARAKQPVSIEGIEFDALISEDHTLEATVPEYPVEEGFVVSDAILLNAEKLDMVLYVTETPVTWYERHGTGQDRVDDVCQQLEELYYKKEPLTIVKSDRTYTDMAIESLTISKSTETGYAREIPISFVKVRVTTAKTTTIPDSYGKSGETEAPAGTANTTTGSSGSGSSSGGGSDNSSSAASKTSTLSALLGKSDQPV